MLWKGHLKAGITIGTTAAILIAPQYVEGIAIIPTVAISSISTMITALLPDLDSENSKASRKLPIIKIIRILCMLNIMFSVVYLLEFQSLMLFIINILLSIIIYKMLGHRKLLHSEFLPIIIYLFSERFIGFSNFFSTGLYLGLMCGVISHLIGDSFTEDGIYPLYPLKIKFRITRFKSGKDDTKINIIILILCLFLIFAKFIIFKK